jgi:preprotein translocase subunit YajC
MGKITTIVTSLFLFALQSPLLAQVEDAPPARDQGMWQTLIMIIIFLGFFYLILFRPEQKRRKAAEELRSQLKKGDRVTAIGIIGTVVQIQEDTVILKMYDGSKIEVLKSVVSEVLPGSPKDVGKTDNKDDKKIEILNADKE